MFSVERYFRDKIEVYKTFLSFDSVEENKFFILNNDGLTKSYKKINIDVHAVWTFRSTSLKKSC